jgi:coenzyme F420 hydrogenase subunit beta
MSQINTEIKAVIDNDLCIACGACIPACPRDSLEPTFNDYRGSNEVRFVNDADCIGCSAPCVEVCPSIKIDFAAISANADTPPERDGWVEDIYLGYSPLFQNDGKSSSGGVLRALTHYALKNSIPILTLTKADNSGVDYSPGILKEQKDLSKMPGSIYHSTSFVGAIELLRGLDEPCVLIGIPCQLAGIFNYITHVDPLLETKIQFTYGIVCGWMYSYHAHQAFTSNKKIQTPLTDISYRGEDKVGLLKLKTEKQIHKFNRRVFPNFISKIDYKSAYSTDLNRLRCRLCQDHTNLLADIVAGDAWLARKPDQKLSVIGVRSSRGARLITQMVEGGYLKLEKGSFQDIVESQSANLVYARTARKLAKFLSVKGISSPKYIFKTDSNDIRLSLAQSLAFQLELFRRSLVRRRYYRSFWWMYLLKYMTNQSISLPKRITRKLKRHLKIT